MCGVEGRAGCLVVDAPVARQQHQRVIVGLRVAAVRVHACGELRGVACAVALPCGFEGRDRLPEARDAGAWQPIGQEPDRVVIAVTPLGVQVRLEQQRPGGAEQGYRERRLVRRCPGYRAAHVLEVRLIARQPQRLILGPVLPVGAVEELEHCRSHGAPRGLLLARCRETGERIEARRLGKLIAWRIRRQRIDQRAVDKPRDQIDGVAAVPRSVSDTTSCGIQRKAAGKYPEPVEYVLLGRRQQLVAPVECGLQRTMVPVVDRGARLQQPQPVPKTFQQRSDPERRHPGSGKLECERIPVKTAADLGDRRPIRARERKAPVGGRRALHE